SLFFHRRMRRQILALFVLSLVYAERDRTSCFNYIDCLEQSQLQFKTCSGGTAVALSLERRTKMMSEMLDDNRKILDICSANMRKESLDFDTLQSLVNEDSRECFQKIPFTPSQSIPADCDYPLSPLPTREIPHGRCLSQFQRDRHQCEKLLRCCPEHNACAERMNALSIAYQLARKKSREISDRMMECISEETAKENERKAIAGEEIEEIKEEEPTTFPTLSPTTSEPDPIGEKKKLWVPNKIARLSKSIVGDVEPEEEEKEEEEEATTTVRPRRVKISDSIVPSSDGGMPFRKPDKEMRKRIQKRLQLTPSALLEKNREEFFEKFDKARKEKEAESTEKAIEKEDESEEEEQKEYKKVAIVKFLLEKADTEMTEKVITMLASGDMKGLKEMEKKEKKRRKNAILKALPADSESSEEHTEKMRKRVSIENVIKQTLEKVSSDHKEQKKALMKNIKSALVQQKQSMEKMVQVAKEREAEESSVDASLPELTTIAPSTATATPVEETTKKPETAEEIERSILEKKEAKLSEELKQRIGLENEFRKITGEETTTVETIMSVAQTDDVVNESHKKLDIRPIIDSSIPSTSRPILDSDVTHSTTEPSTTTETISTTLRTIVDSEPTRNTTRHSKKRRGKGSRHARRTKNGGKIKQPSEKFCMSYGHCESLAWDYEQRCDKKFNPITVTFGIEDSQLRQMLLNNSKSDSSVVTQVCLRPVDKSVHNSVLQLQHIERGVRKACLSLGRDKPTLTTKEKEECRILSHFSVIEMEDWLEQTHGHTEANLAECQARTAGIAASCQELSSCCSAVSACEQYIGSSPVRKMRVEAIQLLLAQQDDCENRMEKTLKQLHQHFRLKPARR
ncbi:hypothetical protein PFISCL1PPCAC_6263, partial [Pristionchus fissidentatus]